MHSCSLVCRVVAVLQVGTHFEEGGLRADTGEFGKSYVKYAAQVGMFFPKLRYFQGVPVRLD